VGESYAETPVVNYNPSPHSVLGKIIQQQINHKPAHTQNPSYKVIERNLNSFIFSLLVTQLLWITTCNAQMRRKLHGGENYGFWVATGGRMFLRNFGNKLRKDDLMANKATTPVTKVYLHLIYLRSKSQIRNASCACNIHRHTYNFGFISLLFPSYISYPFCLLSFPSTMKPLPPGMLTN